MKFGTVTALCLAVLFCLCVASLSEAARLRPRGRGRAALPRVGRNNRFPAPRRGRAGSLRQGRQEGGDDAAAEGESDIPNGCDPNSPMGPWLLFKGMKVYCTEAGIMDFGPYGGPPSEDEEADANAV